MNIVLWVVQALLGLAFAAAGANKVFNAEKAKAMPQMKWMKDVSDPLLRFIGLSEIAGALGLILPMLTGILPWLTPLAAALLGVVMVLAIAFHARRGEYAGTVPNLVLLLLAAFVAWGRWDLFSLL
ncbi:MAG: DoxX family protein [Anaerolineales bacterium]|nr:DoxX family protein [Anaerolineales bacterium]